MFQQNLTKTWILKTDYFFFVLLCYFLKLVACCIAQADLELKGSQVAGIFRVHFIFSFF